MKAVRKLITPRVMAGLAVASGLFGATSLVSTGGTAQADPIWTTGVVGIGADVTQDLWAAYSGASPAPGGTQAPTYYTPLAAAADANYDTVQSYDANPPGGTTVVPGCIITKAGGNCFDRPNSSTAGILALYDEVTGAQWENSSNSASGPQSVSGQFSFARSARGPKNTSGSTLTFIPYARDGLGILEYTTPGSSSTLGALTEAELHTLYTNTSSGSETINGLTTYACLTISGSAPRSNLESALGSISDTTALDSAEAADAANYPGGSGVEPGLCPNVTQNSGNAFLSAVQAISSISSAGLPPNTAAVIPISAGNWESQANGVALDRSNLARTAGVDLADITNASNTDLGKPYISGTIGSGPNKGSTGEVPNLSYYSDSNWGYTLYTVVSTAAIQSGFGENKALVDLFVGSGSSQCAGSAQSTAQDFGFASLSSLTPVPATCGSVTTTGTEPNG